jgi:DNA-binding NarL/FixJ family response regulator
MMRIIFTDDHAVVRHGYASLVKMMLPNYEVNEAADAEHTLALLDQYDDVKLVVLDINLEHSSGLTLGKQIHQRYPHLAILFFSMFDEISMIHQALQSGGGGYISKRSEPEDMIEAIKTVLAGRTYLSAETAVKIATLNLQPQKNINQILTPREFDVFLATAKGHTRQDIANMLSVSSKTVSNTMTQIRQKLAITSQTELVKLAIQHGYVDA